jgi:uncharacterized coiled-coil protein SlyX
MDDRQKQLEELLAHQQQMLDDLNGVVTELRLEIDRILAEQHRLKTTVSRLLEFQEGADLSADEKPPHY